MLGLGIRAAIGIAAGLLFLSPTPQQSDTEPPILVGFDIGPAVVDVTMAAGTVTCTATAVDAPAGVSVVGCSFFHGGAQQNAGCNSSTPSSGDANNGTWTCNATIPQYSAAGTWTLNELNLYDNAGNQLRLVAADVAQMGFTTTFEVVSDPDLSPPSLAAFSVSPAVVDVTMAAGTVTCTATAVDAPAGVSVVGCSFFHGGAQQNAGCNSSTPSSGDANNGTWTCNATIPQYSAAGTWTLNELNLYDNAGNQLRLVAADVAQMGFTTTFEVVSDPDLSPPSLAAFSVSPAVVDVTMAAGTVTCTATAVDAPAGVSVVGCSFFHGGAQQNAGCNSSTPSSGDANNGTWTCNATIPQYSAAGTWTLNELNLYDNAGNQLRLVAADVAQMGFTTTFEVLGCSDTDGDGFYYSANCGTPRDCNDASPTTYPGAPEFCDGYDNDCDNNIDNASSCDRSCDSPGVVGAPIQVTSAPDEDSAPVLAWSGSTFGIVWSRVTESAKQLLFSLLDVSGAPASPALEFTPYTSYSYDKSMVWNGSEFSVAWGNVDSSEPFKGVYVARADDAGLAVDHGTRLFAGRVPFHAWSGSKYGLVRSGDQNYVYPVDVAVLGSAWNAVNDFSIAGAAYPDDQAIVSHDDEHAVVWHAGSRLYLSRLGSDGARLADDTVVFDDPSLTNSHVNPRLVWTGASYGLFWLDVWDRIYFRPVSANGTLLASPTYVAAPQVLRLFTVTWTGEEYAAAWLKYDTQNVVVTRFDSVGVQLGSNIVLGDSTLRASLAWTGASYAVVWDNLASGEINMNHIRCDCSTETCNGSDDDCDGVVDNGLIHRLYRDADGDGFGNASLSQDTCEEPPGWVVVGGDCNDSDPLVNPAIAEACNAIDDNCNALVDEDALGEDTDADGVHNACDNCRQVANPTQLDTDHDAVGNSCDNCTFVVNPSQADTDLDARGDPCDNCRLDYNPFQDDYDSDRAGDACDNCLFDYNPFQTDLDADIEGDICDLDDGIIYILFHQPEYVEWQEEVGFSSWNSYRGDLSVLRGGGPYTQLPGSSPLANRQCGLTDPWAFDGNDPQADQAAFFLTTGIFGGESGLGTDSAGNVRPNANPCP